MNPHPALILSESDEAPDVLSSMAATTVAGGKLRSGMVLLDDLDCPVYVIDHRIGSAGPRTGAVEYLAENLEQPGRDRIIRHANAGVKVAAR